MKLAALSPRAFPHLWCSFHLSCQFLPFLPTQINYSIDEELRWLSRTPRSLYLEHHGSFINLSWYAYHLGVSFRLYFESFRGQSLCLIAHCSPAQYLALCLQQSLQKSNCRHACVYMYILMYMYTYVCECVYMYIWIYSDTTLFWADYPVSGQSPTLLSSWYLECSHTTKEEMKILPTLFSVDKRIVNKNKTPQLFEGLKWMAARH